MEIGLKCTEGPFEMKTLGLLSDDRSSPHPDLSKNTI